MSLETLYQQIRTEVAKVIFGQEDAIDLALAALFANGHVLLEGPPGVAKTLLVRSIAAALDMQYGRVQMTPDLLPGDITGSTIYREDRHEFEFRRPTEKLAARCSGVAGSIASSDLTVM